MPKHIFLLQEIVEILINKQIDVNQSDKNPKKQQEDLRKTVLQQNFLKDINKNIEFQKLGRKHGEKKEESYFSEIYTNLDNWSSSLVKQIIFNFKILQHKIIDDPSIMSNDFFNTLWIEYFQDFLLFNYKKVIFLDNTNKWNITNNEQYQYFKEELLDFNQILKTLVFNFNKEGIKNFADILFQKESFKKFNKVKYNLFHQTEINKEDIKDNNEIPLSGTYTRL